MILRYTAFLILFIAVIVKFDYILLYIKNISSIVFGKKNSEKTKLLVGILSAQSNFKARKAIRETWKQFSINKSIEIKFLIGEEVCPYPVEDRVTPYDCDLWLINVPKALSEYSTVGAPITTESCEIGFTFLIKTDIIIKQLGLDYVAFSGNTSDRARVIIVDSKSGNRVASATFIKEPTEGFVWKPVKPIVLEKGFEGEIHLIGKGLQTLFCSNVLQYIAPVYYFETLNDSGLYSAFELGNFKSSIVGMNYSLKGEIGLEELLVQRIARFDTWSLSVNLLKQQLEDEQRKYDDILFLGGFVDVYDNLSFKISVFFDWVKKLDDWFYILKTDDDVFIDLPLVEKGLQGSWDVWTCMRAQSPNPWGKWRDRISKEYPLFPSGSGYVLSMETIKRLHLKPQSKLGEDVMLGYALEEAKKPLTEPCYWACGTHRSDYHSKCNVPELNSNHLRKIWELYAEIGRIPNNT